MLRIYVRLAVCLAVIGCVLPMAAQQSSAAASGVVPSVVKFSDTLTDVNGKPLTGVVGVTFSLYKDSQGGAPLWLETQNVQPDKNGHYTVMLGSNSSQGLPSDLFASGEARWLGVQAQSQAEQPRTMLMSVPYALKAADATTVGGLPPSAFVLAAPSSLGSSAPSSSGLNLNSSPAVLSGSGKAHYIPIWTSSSKLGDSVLFQLGKGASAQLGIGTTTPASTLDVNGTGTIRGLFSLPATGTATSSGGFNSQPIDLVTSVFNTSTNTAVPQTFQWQAEPVGNNTSDATGSLNLLFAQGSGKPAETGLQLASNGQITFATGQTFPGAGTVTSVGSGAGLTGGPITGSGTLSIATAGVSNAMLQNSSITLNANSAGGVTAPGAMTLGSTYAIGLKPCSANQVLEYSGSAWNCVTLAPGTITGVTAGTDLTGGGSSGNVTLNLDTTKVPQLAAPNAFTAPQSVTAPSSDAIVATTTAPGAVALWGIASATSGGSTGLLGTTSDAAGVGVLGSNLSNGPGVNGLSGTSFTGCTECINNSYGVNDQSSSGYGLVGTVGSSGVDGVHGESWSENSAVAGLNFNTTSGYGVYGLASSPGGTGVAGINNSSSSGIGGGFFSFSSGDALFVYNQSGGYAAFLEGNVDVDGNLSKAGGSFKIDHPLDPANKYLYHSFVESPDMKNIYDGVATLNANGEATIEMPDWFGVLNRDFRYQLTCIGGFAPVYIAEELANNQFKIGGGRAGMRISWQITGIRQDAWANAHRIPVEQEKEAKLKGLYLHPELYGAPAEKQIQWARHPGMMKKLQQDQEQMKEKQTRLTESPTIARPTRPIPPPIVEKPATLIPPAALPHRATK
jgi:hypothetical protein